MRSSYYAMSHEPVRVFKFMSEGIDCNNNVAQSAKWTTDLASHSYNQKYNYPIWQQIQAAIYIVLL